MIKIINTIKEMQSYSNSAHKDGKTVGFVPTMGYLHEGHLSLVKASKNKSNLTVVSVFVNPTQFGPNEDFNKYPRDFEKDKALLEEEGVDVIFYPESKEIYPEHFQTYVEVTEIQKKHEGEFRPTHFKGVATIVSILFNIVKPDFAFFGQKDAQQVSLLKQMVRDLKFEINIIVCPIIREESGLAKSSRNIYLSDEEKQKALLLYNSLNMAKQMIEQGERKSSNIIKKMNQNFLAEKKIHLNYIRIVEENTFQEPEQLEKGKSYFILIACKIGTTRLIDNLLFSI
ncbi:MAG TPA: pantoate--beta-alanine ligase [Ignavibacteriaceae bacterium]|nr:pantoate--beta-alanine ligase [Ignavibacteriaceae bacterium]